MGKNADRGPARLIGIGHLLEELKTLAGSSTGTAGALGILVALAGWKLWPVKKTDSKRTTPGLSTSPSTVSRSKRRRGTAVPHSAATETAGPDSAGSSAVT